MKERIAAPPHPTTTHVEAYDSLLALARGKTGRIPAELLVRHALDIYRTADWPVQRAAVEALLRRWEFAGRDGLRIAARPKVGAPFGRYQTRRPREPARPYQTLLRAVEPLRGSCDCPDFLRNSLGVCKHLLTVLDDLAARPRVFARSLAAAPERPTSGGLSWNPVRPLLGPGDWLDRVRWRSPAGGRTRGRATSERARKWFTPEVGESWVLKSSHRDRPKRRLALVEDLLLLARANSPGGTAEPALLAMLRDEHQALRRIVSDLADGARLRRSLRSLKRDLYPYQVDGVARFLARGRLLLADDMGLGKTAQAIAACQALWHCGKVQRGLLIVPASLKFQWLQEWQAFSDTPLEIVEGSPDDRAARYRRRRGVLLCNYEQVLRDLDLMRAFKPEVIVLDEAQRIKNWATKTAACVKQLQPPYRLVLTGTPMENRIGELASVMDWVDDMALEPKWRLVPWHSVLADGSNEVVGARNLDTLRERLAPSMVRRRRPEILSQLPTRTDTAVPVELTAEQREEHDALGQPIAALVHQARKRPLTQAEFLRLMSLLTTQRIIANGLAQYQFLEVWPAVSGVRSPDDALLRSLSSPKLIELREIFQRIAVEQGRKIVVFSQWRRMLKLAQWAVSDLVEEHALRTVFFTGHETQKRRTHNIVDFHDDPATRVLFATDAGGVGLNLQRAATCCINLELPWNPAVLEQRIGRIHRLGQELPIDVYNLISRDSIEARIADLIRDKSELFRGLFDGESNEIGFDGSGSFVAGLEKVVEPGPATARDGDGAREADIAAEHEIDEILSAADEKTDDPEPADAEHEPARALRAATEVPELLRRVAVHRTADGGMRIEAPPEAAATLAALFEGVASLLRGGEK